MKKLLSAACLSLLAIQAHAASTTLTFEDVQAGTSLSNYGGFTWTASGGWLGNGTPPASFVSNTTDGGFAHAAVSPSNYVANFQRTLTAKWNGPGTIDFTGAWWTALEQDTRPNRTGTGVWLSFVGKRQGLQLYTTGSCNALGQGCTNPISSLLATEISLNWTGIDELVVTRVSRPFTEVVESYAWAMDNFTYVTTPVPEPSVLALMAAGLSGLALVRRRTRCA